MSTKVKEITPTITPAQLKAAKARVERLRAGKLTSAELDRRKRWDLEKEEVDRTGVVVVSSDLSE